MQYLKIDNVAKSFGSVHALQGVNLSLGIGEIKCIIGPNGCGKSTLFNVLTGTLKPSSGAVFLRDKDITRLAPHEIARMGVARKFQVPGIMPELTVLEHIEVASLAQKTKGKLLPSVFGKNRSHLYRSILDQAGLWDYADKTAAELPHGIKQRLELCVLAATEPDLLLLDEPTAGMTVRETAETIELIRVINQTTGTAVLVIEHDMTFVRELLCPIVVMMRGKVLTEGTYDEVKKQFGSAIRLSGDLRLMLEIKALESGYIRGASVLKSVELSVATGERLAIMGRNGMGKTLLMQTIIGLIKPDGGTIHFNEKDITELPPHDRSNLGIAYVPQGREVFLDFTVEENLLMGFVGKPWITKPDFDKIYSWFPILAERRSQKAGTMSGGQQQQLAIGRALIGEPSLLLLDEPSEGIQPSIVQEIGETLSGVCRDQGLTVIVVEQNVELVKTLSQSVAFLENGSLVARVETSEIMADPALLEKYMGL